MLNTAVHFSSQTDMWETPQALFDELNAKYHFTLDVDVHLPISSEVLHPFISPINQ